VAESEDPAAAALGPTIVIKKVTKGDHGHHGGAWKVAYADMVTALMALFIVLWILAQDEEVARNVANYFRDPVGFSEGGLASPIPGGSGTPAIRLDETPQSGNPDAVAALDERWREAAREIRVALGRVPVFSKYADQIELSITPEGLRISLIESSDTPLFRIGGTELHPETKALLETISSELVKLPNRILVEGHTDSRKFGPGARVTNWELSTGRAHTARRVMEAAGVSSERMLEVRGFADRQLYNPLDPEDSRNRRVSITLLSDEAEAAHEKTGKETLLP
jgi:chemotaxis protein MotB